MTTYKADDVYSSAREQISRALCGQGRDRDSLVCRILASTIRTYTWVRLYRYRGDRLELSAADGPPSALPHGGQVDRQPVLLAAAERRAIEIPILDEDDTFVHQEPRAELAVPLIAGDRVLGVLAVQSDQRNPFGIADHELLHEVAAALVARTKRD